MSSTLMQFLGSTYSDKKRAKKFGRAGAAGQQQMYMAYRTQLGKGAPKPTASTGSTAGSTAPKATKRTAGTYSAGSLGRPSTSSRGLSS